MQSMHVCLIKALLTITAIKRSMIANLGNAFYSFPFESKPRKGLGSFSPPSRPFRRKGRLISTLNSGCICTPARSD
jgi:hypothetical protein